jgi:dynein light intermediate chain 1, cytosolic
MLDSDLPKRQQERNRRKPPIANEFALGYTYQDVLDADQEGSFRSASRTHRIRANGA